MVFLGIEIICWSVQNIHRVSRLFVRVSIGWGYTLRFFPASICKRFHRRSRSHWNKWGCVYVLRCDFFSAHSWGEQTTCASKITVTCVNIGSRTIFLPTPNHQQRCVEKSCSMYTVQKETSFTVESSAESCGKKSQWVALALEFVNVRRLFEGVWSCSGSNAGF